MNKKLLQTGMLLWGMVFALSSCAQATLAPIGTQAETVPTQSAPTLAPSPSPIDAEAATEAPAADTPVPATAAALPTATKPPEPASATAVPSFQAYIAKKAPCFAAPDKNAASQNLATGETLLVQGRDAGGGWLLVQRISDSLVCWVESEHVVLQVDAASLPVVSAPPTAVPTAGVAAGSDDDDDDKDVAPQPEPVDPPPYP